MHKKLTLSIAMAVVGAGLLVASGFAGAGERECTYEVRLERGQARRHAAHQRARTPTSSSPTRRCVRRRSAGRCCTRSASTLLNYPDKPAPEGSRLVPEGAAGFPLVSKDGKTYTFTIRKGSSSATARRSTAAGFKRAHRARRRPEACVAGDRVHARRRRRRRAQRGQGRPVTGVTAKGQTLTIKLAADPTFLAELAMPFFARGQAEHGDRPEGRRVSPARPVRTGSSAVDIAPVADARAEPELQGQPPGERRPDRLHGQHRPDQSLLQVKAGQADYDRAASRRRRTPTSRSSTASRRAAPAATSSTRTSASATSR